MYKVIRIRVHGYDREEFTVIRAILGVVGGRVILDRVDNVQMEGAVDIDCILIGSLLRCIIYFIKFMSKLAKLRSENINVEILWGV